METLRVSPVPSLDSAGSREGLYDRMNEHGDPSRRPDPSHLSYENLSPGALPLDFGLDGLTGHASWARDPFFLHTAAQFAPGTSPGSMWDTLQQPDFQRAARWAHGGYRQPNYSMFQQSQNQTPMAPSNPPVTRGERPQLNGYIAPTSSANVAEYMHATMSMSQENAPAWTVPDFFEDNALEAPTTEWDTLLAPSSFVTQPTIQPQWTSAPSHTDTNPIAELTTTLDPLQYQVSDESSPDIYNRHTPSTMDSPRFSHTMPEIDTIERLRASISDCSDHSHFMSTNSYPGAYLWGQGPAGDRTAGTSSQQSIASFGNPPSISDDCTSPASDFVFVNHADCESGGSETSTRIKVEPRSSPTVEQPSSSAYMNTFHVHEDSKDQDIKSLVIRRSNNGKRAGGRAVGMHLDPEKAARAKQLREEGVCWLCSFQRDSCTPGEICSRCTKRSHRSQMEHGLGCDRTKLTELKNFFIPDFVTRDYNAGFVVDTFKGRIKSWHHGNKVKLHVYLVWHAPPVPCDLYEYEPKTADMLRQYQWHTNKSTGRRERVEKASPPLAMVEIGQNERRMFEKYVNSIVDQGLEKFARGCFASSAPVDDFQSRMLKLMIRLKPEGKEEAALLKENFRLMVIVYVMARVATLSPSERPLLSKLRSYAGHPENYDRMTSPYMLDQQIKYIFHQLMGLTLDTILKKLNQIFRSSKGGSKWTSAFCSMLALAMSFEMIQRWVHCWQDGCLSRGKVTKQQSEHNAEAACRVIDDKFQFMCLLFRWKYHKGFNPLKDWQEEKVRAALGEHAWGFIQGVTALVSEKNDFLTDRSVVNIAHENQDRYTSRLVARFLLSFWTPA